MLRVCRFPLFALACLAPWLVGQPLAAAEGTSAHLQWNNGDVLAGELLSANAERLQWSAPLFARPLAAAVEHVAAATFDYQAGAERTAEPWRVTLRNGDVIFGALQEINDDHVVLHSARHGTLKINRSAIAVLANVNNPLLIYRGPTGLGDWKASGPTGEATPWTASPDGRLTTHTRSAALFRPLELPEHALIDLTLETHGKLAFRLACSERPSGSVRLESWGDQLVAVRGYDYQKGAAAPDFAFEPILPLKNTVQELRLLIFYDRSANELAVYSPAGELLGKLSKPDANKPLPLKAAAPSPAAGLYLENCGLELTLAQLQVRRWNGAPPAAEQKDARRVQLVDGTMITGNVTGYDAPQAQLLLKEGDSERRIPAADLDLVHFAPETGGKSAPGECVLSYYDGARLTGKLQKIAAGTVALATGFCAEPVAAALPGARELRLSTESPHAPNGPDRLYTAQGTLHGTLVFEGHNAQQLIAWRPDGENTACPLAANCQGRIVRGTGAAAKPFDAKRFRDVVYLTTGDIVPCRIKSIDEQSVHVQTELAADQAVPCKFVQAVELAADAAPEQAGFADPGWRVFPGQEQRVELMADHAQLQAGGGFGHAALGPGNVIRFDLEFTKGSGGLILRLFAVDPEKSEQCLELVVSRQGNRLAVAERETARQNLLQGVSSMGDFKAVSSKATLQVITTQDKVDVLIDDTLAWTGKRSPQNSLGNGIGFFMEDNSTLNPNAKNAEKARQQQRFTLSNFQVSQSSGVTAHAAFMEGAKLAALTIPRFRKENPPPHVMLARNGDLLRGRLESLDADHVHFVSQLQGMDVPRQRVAALVWLREEAAAEASAPESSTSLVRAVLEGGSVLTLTPQQTDGRVLSGSSAAVGRWDLPLGAIRELQFNGFGELNPALSYADWKAQAAKVPSFEMVDPESGEPQTAVAVGAEASDFETTLLDGSKFKLSDQRGKVIVLDFWATWCGPCIMAMPKYLDAVKGFNANQVQFVAINQGETPPTINEFLRKRGWKLHVALDQDESIGRQYAVEGIPYTLVIGPEGKVAWLHMGYEKSAPEALKNTIQSLLNGAATKADTTQNAEPPAATETNARSSEEVPQP